MDSWKALPLNRSQWNNDAFVSGICISAGFNNSDCLGTCLECSIWVTSSLNIENVFSCSRKEQKSPTMETNHPSPMSLRVTSHEAFLQRLFLSRRKNGNLENENNFSFAGFAFSAFYFHAQIFAFFGCFIVGLTSAAPVDWNPLTSDLCAYAMFESPSQTEEWKSFCAYKSDNVARHERIREKVFILFQHTTLLPFLSADHEIFICKRLKRAFQLKLHE